MNYPPKQDKIISQSPNSKDQAADGWLVWFRQVTDNLNFVSPTFSGGHSASIDFTSAAGKLSPWPGFLVLQYATVAAGLTITLPRAPANSVVVVARTATGGSNLVIDGTWTLASQTWITLMSDGTNWFKIMGGSL
jgi:hypothetical protein